MVLKQYSDDIYSYLIHDDVVDHDNPAVIELADMLYAASRNEEEFIRKAYEYVRDSILHSADAGKDEVTCSASEVLAAGHGICFAKSHLLAAILRRKNIPTGFCYQKLILDDETSPVLILHGLNAVYINERRKWIRLDARGNKPGVDAQFSLNKEQLAFPIRPELGEEDGMVIYPVPDPAVVRALREHTSREDLWKDLPSKLEGDQNGDQKI